jgi:hypothetical protein
MKETCGNCKHDESDGPTNPNCIKCMSGGDGWESDRGTEADQAADAHPCPITGKPGCSLDRGTAMCRGYRRVGNPACVTEKAKKEDRG